MTVNNSINEKLTSPSVVSSTQTIGVTSTDGLLLAAGGVATVGAQQWSPRTHYQASGWKTTATAGAQNVDFITELQSIQGAANPTGSLKFRSSVNGSSYVDVLSLDIGVGITVTGGVNLNGNLGVTGAGAQIVFSGSGNSFINSPAAATICIGSTDAAAPVGQTIRVQNVAVGTSNTAAPDTILAMAQGTGTAVGGSFHLKVSPAGTTGSSQNALVDALVIDSTKLATFSGDVAVTGKMTGKTFTTPTTQSGTTYSFVNSDSYVRFTNASAITATIPKNTTTAIDIGTELVCVQAAAGVITPTAASGVTLNIPSGVTGTSNGQGHAFILKKIATDTWDLLGDLA